MAITVTSTVARNTTTPKIWTMLSRLTLSS